MIDILMAYLPTLVKILGILSSIEASWEVFESYFVQFGINGSHTDVGAHAAQDFCSYSRVHKSIF